MHSNLRGSPENVTERKISIRDWISSFDRHRLPSDISPDAFQSIDVEQGRRDESERIRPDDLDGTLMVCATHNNDLYGILNRIRGPEQCAILFWQKLRRLLKEALVNYDEPTEDRVSVVLYTADTLRRLETAFQAYRTERSPIFEAMTSRDDLQAAFLCTHQEFIDALRAVCERPSVTPASAQKPVSLYHNLIVDPATMQEPFMIGLLEQSAREQPQVLASSNGDLRTVLAQLVELDAPTEYTARLAAITVNRPAETPSSTASSSSSGNEPKPEDDDDDDDDDEPGPSTAPPPPPPSQPDPPKGTKRPAAQSSGRRGRQKRGTR